MSSYKEGQVHQLMDSLEAEGFNADHITKLGQMKNLQALRDVLDGSSEIKQKEYLIDFEVKPPNPSGSVVLPDSEQLNGRVRGKWKFDLSKLDFCLDEGQSDERYVEGNNLRKKLTSVPVFGIQLGDFLMKNLHLIPDEWKGNSIFFWGTIYYRTDGTLYVRCIEWNNRGFWFWYDRWLNCNWYSIDPAVVLGK